MVQSIGFGLSAEQRELQALARRFASEEIRPVAQWLDRELSPAETYPRNLVKRASQLGLRTLTLPREYGGRAADTLTQAIVLEEICVGDAGFAMGLLHAWREGAALVRLATDDQRERFLPAFLADDEYVTSLALTESHAGSDHVLPYAGDLGAGPRTTAILDGDVWVINGTKRWISNGNVSRLIFLLARTDMTVPWTEGVSLFLVPTDAVGFRSGRVEDKLGLRLNQNAELVFTECRIPQANLIGAENEGLRVLGSFTGGSMVKEGVKSLGIARSAYEEAVVWTRERVQGGRPIADHEAVGASLVVMATEIEATRALIWKAAWAVDEDHENAPILEGMAKVYAGEMAVRVAVSALELHGGYGVLRENHVEKLVRDAVTMLHAFGGNHAVRVKLADLLAARSRDNL